MIAGVDLAEGHAQQVEDADAGAGGLRLDPEAEVAGEDRQKDDADEQADENPHDDEDLRKVVAGLRWGG